MLLGSVATVRVQRVLAQHGGSLPPTSIAERAKLSRPSVHAALRELIRVGVVEAIGQGRAMLYRLDPRHPLVPALQALYTSEATRTDRVLEAIRAAIDAHQNDVLGAWLYGSVARGEDTVSSDLDVAVAIDQDPADPVVQSIRDALTHVADAEHLTISVVGFSPAEFLAIPSVNPEFWDSLVGDAVPLVGSPPESLAKRLKVGTKRELRPERAHRASKRIP
ncbi:MAG TPA: helix-turn-helix domain-containing protein [Gemmatimonadaceae bacterium]